MSFRQRQSRTSVHDKPRQPKQRACQLLRTLFFQAIVGFRRNPVLHTLADRMAARGKAKMAIVCAAMHKLLHLASGALKSAQVLIRNTSPVLRPGEQLYKPDSIYRAWRQERPTVWRRMKLAGTRLEGGRPAMTTTCWPARTGES